jgi:acyl carrier protein phosphodiesterase
VSIERPVWLWPLRGATPATPVTGPGKFGAVRKHDVHTGVDLYCAEGQPVQAVEAGTVVAILDFTGPKAGSRWWRDTRAVMVEGAEHVVLYGEIREAPELAVGTVVQPTPSGKSFVSCARTAGSPPRCCTWSCTRPACASRSGGVLTNNSRPARPNGVAPGGEGRDTQRRGIVNWLAHALLSEPDVEFRLGNLLADLVKGRDRDGMSANFLRGVKCHQAIDGFTDSHPVVHRSRARIGSGYRHVTGILVDVFYDHFLALDWNRYSTEPLDAFTARLYSDLRAHPITAPEEARAALDRMIRDDRLGSYRTIEGSRRLYCGCRCASRRERDGSSRWRRPCRSCARTSTDWEATSPSSSRYCDRT